MDNSNNSRSVDIADSNSANTVPATVIDARFDEDIANAIFAPDDSFN